MCNRLQSGMDKFQKPLNIAIILAETSHVFCCVLPTLVSVLSLLAGVGVIGSLPISMLVVHDFLHDWELPIIFGSGLLIALGWLLLFYSRRIDCHDTGCGHEPCGPKKKKSSKLLLVASLLFVVNVTVYTVFHRGMGISVPHADHVDHDTHDAHDAHEH